MKKINIIIIIFLLISSCTDNNNFNSNFFNNILNKESPPFTITELESKLADTLLDFTFAGISYSFLNKSEKDVSSITTSFMLFDAKTQSNPFIGSNIFEIKTLISISPRENMEIGISLDIFIYIAPSEPYLIDHFYISEIEYADGSIWRDKNGIYRIK